jgi:hypothetical protein
MPQFIFNVSIYTAFILAAFLAWLGYWKLLGFVALGIMAAAGDRYFFQNKRT